jgi:hypothetical protein
MFGTSHPCQPLLDIDENVALCCLHTTEVRFWRLDPKSSFPDHIELWILPKGQPSDPPVKN